MYRVLIVNWKVLFNIQFILSFGCLAFTLALFYLYNYYEEQFSFNIFSVYLSEEYCNFFLIILIVPHKNSFPYFNSITRIYSTKSTNNSLNFEGEERLRLSPLIKKDKLIGNPASNGDPRSACLNIVNNFLNKYPSSKLAEANITYNLIYSIFT